MTMAPRWRSPRTFGMGASVALVALAPGSRPFRLRRAFLLATGIAFPMVFVAMLQAGLAPVRGLRQGSLAAPTGFFRARGCRMQRPGSAILR